MHSEGDFLQLSGIQHMAFCERQWALINIEQVWVENARTLEGKYLHERVDDDFGDETRHDLRVVRAMPLISYELGLRGVADVVEFIRTNRAVDGVNMRLKNRTGWWQPYPVEYKRGRPKSDDRDAVQLCAQAMALEEMLGLSIKEGYLYYYQTRHRVHVDIGESLRERVRFLSSSMHGLMISGETPKAVAGKHCTLCSLVDMCQPKLTIKNVRSRTI